MALVVIAMSAMVVASCGDDDDDNGGSNGSGIYGTWVSTLEDGEVVTVVIAQNSMKIQWAYDDESETEIYDSFSYDESTKKSQLTTARQFTFMMAKRLKEKMMIS